MSLAFRYWMAAVFMEQYHTPIAILVVLAPILYMVLSNRRLLWSFGGYHTRAVFESEPRQQLKPSPSKDAPTNSSMFDYSKFDMSNLRVTKILVHPIKSCKGTSVEESKYTLEGLEHDRKWCIIRQDNHLVVTARQVSKMVLIHPHIIADPLVPEGGLLQVTFPEDSGREAFSLPLAPSHDTLQKWESVDVELWGKKDIQGHICETDSGRSPSTILSEYFGFPVHLVVKGARVRTCRPTLRFPELDAPSYFQDGYPLLFMSEESVGAVQEQIRDMVGTQGVSDKWAEKEFEVERFRPNIVFKGAGVPFVEDVVTELSISSEKEAVDETRGTIRLVSKCTRCLLPNIDTATGIRDEAVPYKVIMKFRKGLDPKQASAPCVGCNAIVTGEGTVKVGDWLHVCKMGTV